MMVRKLMLPALLVLAWPDAVAAWFLALAASLVLLGATRGRLAEPGIQALVVVGIGVGTPVAERCIEGGQQVERRQLGVRRRLGLLLGGTLRAPDDPAWPWTAKWRITSIGGPRTSRWTGSRAGCG